jgi:hypothetical protein
MEGEGEETGDAGREDGTQGRRDAPTQERKPRQTASLPHVKSVLPPTKPSLHVARHVDGNVVCVQFAAALASSPGIERPQFWAAGQRGANDQRQCQEADSWCDGKR